MVDITARAQVPQITPTATARPITEKGSAWIFRNSASERFFAAVHAKYLAEHAGKKVACPHRRHADPDFEIDRRTQSGLAEDG
jgi:ABC-type branched-subunit amino acid transport system substrate-binding protein